MSIHISNFATAIEGNTLTRITIKNNRYMEETMKLITSQRLVDLIVCINNILDELNKQLGEERFTNKEYQDLLTLYFIADKEYFDRLKEMHPRTI